MFDGDLANNSISGSNKYPTKDATFNTNTNVKHYIGANNESGSVQDTTFDGLISNAYLIDGLAIAPAFLDIPTHLQTLGDLEEN